MFNWITLYPWSQPNVVNHSHFKKHCSHQLLLKSQSICSAACLGAPLTFISASASPVSHPSQGVGWPQLCPQEVCSLGLAQEGRSGVRVTGSWCYVMESEEVIREEAYERFLKHILVLKQYLELKQKGLGNWSDNGCWRERCLWRSQPVYFKDSVFFFFF